MLCVRASKILFPRRELTSLRRLLAYEVKRRAWANGIICVDYQRFLVGRALAGQVVTGRIESGVLHLFYEGQLVKSVPKRMKKEVTQFRAHRPHDHKKAGVNDHPEPLHKPSMRLDAHLLQRERLGRGAVFMHDSP